MIRLITAALFIVLSGQLTAQNFFNQEFNQKKQYVVLTNPTVRNLKTIDYLLNNKLLKINTRKINFVGVYFDDQNYDFNQTVHFLDTAGLNEFHLHEIRGELKTSKLFEENSITRELKKIFENSSGIFFFGGPDIPPAVYGEDNSYSVVTDPQRHYFETTFLFHLLGSSRNESFEPFMKDNPAYFVTGFCLGMQTMNVATGGTMIQDIPADLFGAETPEATVKIGQPNLHRNYWQEMSEDTLLMGINFHPVKFTDHPFFGNNVKVRKTFQPKILSSHHQAIKKLGKNLEVTAISTDEKIIEGIAHRIYPHVFAVQFHPEVPALYENMELRKFHPADSPDTYHHILGNECVKFHEQYWKFVSKTLKKAVRAKN